MTLLFTVACSSNSKKAPPISKKKFKGKNYIGAVIETFKVPKTSRPAIKLGFLIPGASASRMGLKSDDLIIKVNGKEVTDKDSFAKFIRNYDREKEIVFSVLRGSELTELEIKGHVDRRVYGNGPKIMAPLDKDLLPSFIKKQAEPFTKINQKKMALHNLEEKHQELKDTFSLMTNRADFYRRNIVTYVQRNPFELANVSNSIIKNLKGSKKWKSLEGLADLELPYKKEVKFKGGDPIAYIKKALDLIYKDAFAAYKDISREEKITFFNGYSDLLDYIDKNVLLKDLEDMKRFTPLHEILKKVNLEKIMSARTQAMALNDEKLLNSLSNYLRVQKKNQVSIQTRYGLILIGDEKNNWYKTNPNSITLLIDLGGDDLYTGGYGSATDGRPFSILIDRGGNDTYEGAKNCSFGCGILGLGIHIDKSGNDKYLGNRLSQGASLGGAGILIDESGDDVYKSLSHSQAYSLYGLAALIDYKGDDTYDAKLFSQGVAVSGGVSLLQDIKGNDTYEARGLYPSSYGTNGIFRSFSQGMGFGFRGFMSGGIGILSDGSGVDNFIGGNFSQGAGYYFGFGLFHNGGIENDNYLGSRYTQGATAHYALAAFLEEGGNDIYRSRIDVATAMAWDLGITYFEDTSGNDQYYSTGMSLGAAAMNSISIFVDRKGDDFYDLDNFPAFIPTNQARDGISLAYFFDLQGVDKYKKIKNNAHGVTDVSGFWFDYNKKIELLP